MLTTRAAIDGSATHDNVNREKLRRPIVSMTLAACAVIAIASPVLAQRLRERIEALLPTRIGAERMAELLLYQDIAKLLSGIQAGDLDRLGRRGRSGSSAMKASAGTYITR